MHIAAMKPVALTSAEVPAELIEKSVRLLPPRPPKMPPRPPLLKASLQSEEIVAKRIEGGVQKYLKEVSLFSQAFVKNDKQTVEQMLKAAGTTVKNFTLYVVGEGIEEGGRLRRRSGCPGGCCQGCRLIRLLFSDLPPYPQLPENFHDRRHAGLQAHLLKLSGEALMEMMPLVSTAPPLSAWCGVTR